MTNYKLNEEKMFADIADGTAIIINGQTGIYYGMNNFATLVFEHLINGASVENILEELKKISDNPSDIEQKLKTFIDLALEKELIIASLESKNIEIIIDKSAAKADEFNLNISEYNDAQELLLADPIHEVKEETGWSAQKDSLNTDAEDVARREAKMN